MDAERSSSAGFTAVWDKPARGIPFILATNRAAVIFQRVKSRAEFYEPPGPPRK